MKSEYNRRLCHNIKILMKLMSRVIYQHLLSNESVIQSLSCVQLCDPTECSKPGFPVFHYQLRKRKFEHYKLLYSRHSYCNQIKVYYE